MALNTYKYEHPKVESTRRSPFLLHGLGKNETLHQPILLVVLLLVLVLVVVVVLVLVVVGYGSRGITRMEENKRRQQPKGTSLVPTRKTAEEEDDDDDDDEDDRTTTNDEDDCRVTLNTDRSSERNGPKWTTATAKDNNAQYLPGFLRAESAISMNEASNLKITRTAV